MEPSTLLRSLILLFILMLLGTAALAETRVALVIGAGQYKGDNALANPTNDAKLASSALRQSGFDVTMILDPDLATFSGSLATFGKKAELADVALVYYAGHGVEVDGVNWLLPVTADGSTAADLPSQAIRASAVADVVAGARKVRLVILDACRHNPYAASFRRAAAHAATSDNVVILFAAQPGAAASDGSGAANIHSSPFAAAFAALVREPGLRLASLPARLSRDVAARLGREQRPDQRGIFDEPDWMFTPSLGTVSAPLTPEIFNGVPVRNEVMRQFVPVQPSKSKPAPTPVTRPTPVPKPAAPAAPVPFDFERAAWDLCAKGKTASPCDAYLAKYPGGRWADLAATRIKDMNAQPASAPSRPTAPVAAPVDEKEKADWLLCQNSTVSGPCERYVETYPAGRWTEQAKTRIRSSNAAAQDKLVAEQAKAAAAQQASQEQAAAAAEKADWGNCQTSNSAAACERFIIAYPASARTGAARELVAKFRADSEEKAAWTACQNGDSALQCEKYLAAFRSGPNAATATSLIAKYAKADQDRLKAEQEKTAWSLCESGKTALPCNDYLRAFADGRFADSARTRIRILETAATEPEMVPALGLVVKRNDKGEMVVVSVQQFSSAMGNVFGGDIIIKINDQPTKSSDLPRQTIEAGLAAQSGRIKLLVRRGPAAVTVVIRAR